MRGQNWPPKASGGAYTLAQARKEIPPILANMGIKIGAQDLDKLIVQAWQQALRSGGATPVPPPVSVRS